MTRVTDLRGYGVCAKALGLLLGALSIAIGVRAFLRPEAAQGSPDFVRALGIAALGALYTALAPFLGYLLAMTLLVGAATVYYGAKPRPMVAAFSVGTAALLWLLFAAMLGVALPRSALF